MPNGNNGSRADFSTVFILTETKNGQERVLVLNAIARRVLESVRGHHPDAVFTYKGNPMKSMFTTAWKKARERAGLPQMRVHDLRHTFGHRLRAAGVSFEDRQDLLGHASARITTHYSAPEVSQLLKSANLICEKRPATVLRVISDKSGAKLGQSERRQKDRSRTRRR
jgi:integrase